jgi:glycosyltransferase involved in cell wall biosynthesis
MTQQPWLSAIVPSHNGERWLAAALQSVAEQGDSGVEVILVDSSDSDDSLDIAARFAHKAGVRAYRRPDLRSWMAKTNFAAAEAQGAWLCMLHQDDLWLPNRCRELARWVAAHPRAVMHLHPAHLIDEAGRRLGLWRCPLPGGEAAVEPGLLLERLLVQNFVAIPAPTIRRDAYLEVGGLDEGLWYTADWDLYFKLLFSGEVYYHPDALACFRIHRKSLTMSGSKGVDDFRSQMEIVRDRYIGRLTRRRRATLRIANASIAVNVALAAAGNGKPGRMIAAVARLLALGPRHIVRYFHHSRIIERAYPRLRARLAGGL